MGEGISAKPDWSVGAALRNGARLRAGGRFAAGPSAAGGAHRLLPASPVYNWSDVYIGHILTWINSSDGRGS